MADEPAWHEDREFWETFQDVLFPPESFEQAATQVDQFVELLDLDAPASILDIPCGVGRHAVELAERGYAVTGVDATPAYLETARERASAAGVDLEFVEGDLREFRREEAFDVVLNLYTSFGYFEDRADDERVARGFYRSLKPGGRLLMDLASKETLASRFEARTWEERDGTYVLFEREITDAWSWIENRWVLVEGGDVRTFSVSHRLYSAYELSQLLADAGFQGISQYGNLEGDAFDQDAERLLVVAEK